MLGNEKEISVCKAEKYRHCNVCNKKDNIYNITLRYGGTNTGTQIALCDECIEKLMQKLSERGTG